jgi:hypothetical protein
MIDAAVNVTPVRRGTAFQCPRHHHRATSPLPFVVRGSGAVLLYMPPKAQGGTVL